VKNVDSLPDEGEQWTRGEGGREEIRCSSTTHDSLDRRLGSLQPLPTIESEDRIGGTLREEKGIEAECDSERNSERKDGEGYAKKREGWKRAHDNSAVGSISIPSPSAIYAANPRTSLRHISPDRQVSDLIALIQGRPPIAEPGLQRRRRSGRFRRLRPNFAADSVAAFIGKSKSGRNPDR